MISGSVKGKRCFAELKRDIHTGGAADTAEPEETEKNTLYEVVNIKQLYNQLDLITKTKLRTAALVLKKASPDFRDIQEIIDNTSVYISDTTDTYIIHIIVKDTFTAKMAKMKVTLDNIWFKPKDGGKEKNLVKTMKENPGMLLSQFEDNIEKMHFKVKSDPNLF